MITSALVGSANAKVIIPNTTPLMFVMTVALYVELLRTMNFDTDLFEPLFCEIFFTVDYYDTLVFG